MSLGIGQTSFQSEAEKRIRELYLYDVLRADRCISSNSMEGRVPFGDQDFVRYVMHVQVVQQGADFRVQGAELGQQLTHVLRTAA